MNEKRAKFAIDIIGKHIKNIYVNHSKEAHDRDVDFSEYGTPKEIYLKEVFRLYMIINDELDRIKYTEHFLTIKKVPKHYLKNQIKEIEYYKHHIDFFHIECISIFDYCVNLINHALILGIPVRKCNAYKIIENTTLKGGLIIEKLKSFEKEISELKKNRNIIIHQGDFESVSLNEIDSKIICNELFDFGPEKTKYFEKKKLQQVKETIKKINDIILTLEDYVGEIYKCLIPIIERKIKIFEIEE